MLNFAQPWMLWGLLAAFVPLLIHLINRWRHRSYPWAAMIFLKQAQRELSGKKQFRNFLILALRVLTIIFLVLALARPRNNDWLGKTGGQLECVVLVLDRSASMEGKTAGADMTWREAALEVMKRTIPQLSGTRFFLLESAYGEILEITSPDILLKLPQVQSTETTADMPMLMLKAKRFLQEESVGRGEIWVMSDGQKEDWDVSSSDWDLFNKTKMSQTFSGVRYLAMGDRTCVNRSIHVQDVQRDGNQLKLTLIVYQRAPLVQGESSANSVRVRLFVNEREMTEDLSVREGRSVVQWNIDLPDEITHGYGYVVLPDDANEKDNVSYFTFGETYKTKVAVYGDNSEGSAILCDMLAALYDNGKCPLIQKQSGDDLSLDKKSFIVWNDSFPKEEEQKKLAQFVQSGGIVLFLPTEFENNENKAISENILAGMGWGMSEQASVNSLFTIGAWNHKEGVLRDSYEGKSLPLEQILAQERKVINGDGYVLASWQDGIPALVRKNYGDGFIYLLGTGISETISNLSDGYMLIPLLQRLDEDAKSRFSQLSRMSVGDPLPTLPGNSLPYRVDNYHDHKGEWMTEKETGIFRFGSSNIAINRPSKEDVLIYLEPHDVANVLEGVPFASFAAQSLKARSLVTENWRWLDVTALIFILLDGGLCLSRLSGRVHYKSKTKVES